jgi:hypothetical protein
MKSKLYTVPRSSFRRVTPGQGAFFAGLFIMIGLIAMALILS